MQPQLCCFVMCDNITQEGGKYSLVGVFYRIHPVTFPCLHNCYLVVGWYGESGRHSFEMTFIDPGGKELQRMSPFSFSSTPERPYYNAVIEAALPLSGEGIYWFEVDLNGTTLGRFPVHVHLVRPAAHQ